MKFFFLLVVALNFIGCATHAPQTVTLLKSQNRLYPDQTFIKEVPFFKQEQNHCGPASVAMMLKFRGKEIDMQELNAQMYIPGKAGTLQTDISTSISRQGMLSIPVIDLNSLLLELSLGNPVLIFLNLGFEIAPQWHYAVAIGYDLKKPNILLHSGPVEHYEMDLKKFERSWHLGGYWAKVVLSPGQLSVTGTELMHATTASALEQRDMLFEAKKSYESMLTRWPTSLSAFIGMGNVTYTENNFSESQRYLEKATKSHPESSLAWHNLAIAQGANKKLKAAHESSKKALKLASKEDLRKYQENLKEWLK